MAQIQGIILNIFVDSGSPDTIIPNEHKVWQKLALDIMGPFDDPKNKL